MHEFDVRIHACKINVARQDLFPGNPRLYEKNWNCVRIVTVHKSKNFVDLEHSTK